MRRSPFRLPRSRRRPVDRVGYSELILAELNYEVSQNSGLKRKCQGDRCHKVLTGFFPLADLVRAKPQKVVGGITVPSPVNFAMILRMSKVCVVSARNKCAIRWLFEEAMEKAK